MPFPMVDAKRPQTLGLTPATHASSSSRVAWSKDASRADWSSARASSNTAPGTHEAMEAMAKYCFMPPVNFSKPWRW
eukprot:1349050-Alexandrium_andersonii.AAC.1